MDKHSYRALVVREERQGKKSLFQANIEELKNRELEEGEIEILSHYSSLNYKDALSLTGNKGISKKYPHVPGIDVSGVVGRSRSLLFKEGDPVLVTGYKLGTAVWGGFGERVYLPAKWAVPLPSGLTLEEAMIYGTAGFTAAQCVQALLRGSLLKESSKDELGSFAFGVSGATGGVGLLALLILKRLGMKPVAISRKSQALGFFKPLGIEHVENPNMLLKSEEEKLPMLKSRWHGAVDTVGGSMLSYFLRSAEYRATVACCGMVAGLDINTSILPFILRGINLAGIDSALCPMEKRLKIWQELAGPWKPKSLQKICRVIALAEIAENLQKMLKGDNIGRVVVSHFPVD